MPYRKAAALAAGVSASMLVLGSGTARADESSYIQMLDVGSVPYDTPAGAVLMGNTACRILESAGSIEKLEHSLMVGGRSAGEADWTKTQADWLISASVVGLRPQMTDVLKAYGPPFFISQ
jgi:Protein of unknown function (DUF732)